MARTAAVKSALARDLEATLGPDGVVWRPEDILAYEYDGSIDRGLPAAIAFPRDAGQVASAIQIARRHGLPVVPRGAGTGLSGGAIASEGGVVVALTRMTRILEVDAANAIAVVEPGVVNLDLSLAVARHGLRYAPDPSSQKACTLGGNVAENAGGPHCLAYGVTTDHVLGMEVVLADGAVVWFGGRTRGRTGYDLPGVVVGSEGTLGIITKIIVRLQRLPEAVRTLVAVFREMDQASAAVSAIIARGIIPAALEMMDRVAIEAVEPAVHAGYPPEAGAVLLIEVEGLREEAASEADEVEGVCRELGAVEVRGAESPADRERLWAGRKGAIGALGRLAPNYYLVDGVVPRTRLVEVLRRVGEIGQRHGVRIANVFHAGDGNLHPCMLFDERVPGDTERVVAAGAEIMRLCVDVGGALTGEHGVGLEKRDYMPWAFSDADMEAMRKLKAAFVSDGGELFNPDKIFPSPKGCREIPRPSAEGQRGALGPGDFV
ncbi:MAG: FAD-linked oxidase C-terminal domain-containing protein [Chloroflexota bacterium]